jgi:hypothetical protein
MDQYVGGDLHLTLLLLLVSQYLIEEMIVWKDCQQIFMQCSPFGS